MSNLDKDGGGCSRGHGFLRGRIRYILQDSCNF